MTAHSFPFPIRFSRGTLGCFFLFFLLATLSSASAAGYFVSATGDPGGDGLSRETAFATIQQGVDALQPGDTLTIGPGEYFETVSREDLGNEEVETLIRAEFPGTAVLRGDVPAPEFEKVDGYRFVYAAPFDREPKAVLEHDTLRTLFARVNVAELEFDPGFFHYDADAKRLYISSSDLRPPTGRRYSVAVAAEGGLELENPKRVVIDGLAATGFFPGWGINLNGPEHCVVRNCILSFSEGGLRMGPKGQIGGEGAGSHNVVEDCVSFAHTFGGIVRYGANHDVIRNNHTFKTFREGREHFGIMHYLGMKGPLLMQNNLSWGQNFDYSVKPSGQDRLENSVALGFIRMAHMSHNLVGGGNEYDRGSDASPDNILFRREQDLDRDFEFVDPLNLDFRLQPDSRFRGTGPEGADRGPFPYEANIFYVSPGGDDEADGLSMRAPWRTLERAVRDLGPGDTLYLAGGKYEGASWKGAGGGEEPIRVRGRGRGTVTLAGPPELSEAKGIEFERLHFAAGINLKGGGELSFHNCTFSGALRSGGVNGLRVTHSVFVEAPVDLGDSSGVFLSGNIYNNAAQPAVLTNALEKVVYSDYNSYAESGLCWRTEEENLSLEGLQPRFETHARTLSPEFVTVDGSPALANPGAFRNLGPHRADLGIHHYYEAEPREAELVGPFLHSVSDTTANLEWWASKAGAFELRWGPTPAMEHRVEIPAAFQYSGFSLTGLESGATYYAAVRALGEEKEVIKESDPVEFQTSAVAREPAVYHVSTGGDDSHDGLTSESAFRTVSRAAVVAGAGDTVLVGEGEYPESIWIRATGTRERPVRFRSAPGERAQVRTFLMSGKSHVQVDGFYTSGEMRLVLCNDIEITRCFARGPLLQTRNCTDVRVKNSVATRGYPFSAVNIQNSPGFRMENSVILNPSIQGALVKNEPGQTAFFRRNIFTDSIPFKAPIAYFSIARAESLKLEENCFYMRAPDPEMGLEKRDMFQFYGDEAYERCVPVYGLRPLTELPPSVYTELTRASLEDFQELFGETVCVMTNPRFRGAAGLNLEDGARFTEDDNLSNPNNTGYLILSSDRMGQDLDFPDLFTTDPELIEKGIGLIPEDFKDFHFERIPHGDVNEKTRNNP